jgi:hypothetical protein
MVGVTVGSSVAVAVTVGDRAEVGVGVGSSARIVVVALDTVICTVVVSSPPFFRVGVATGLVVAERVDVGAIGVAVAIGDGVTVGGWVTVGV